MPDSFYVMEKCIAYSEWTEQEGQNKGITTVLQY